MARRRLAKSSPRGGQIRRILTTRSNWPYLIGAGVGATAGLVWIFGRPAIGAARIPVPPGFVPVTILVKSIGDGQVLRTDAARRYKKMKAAAAKDGIKLVANSGFRSVPKQALLYAQALVRGGFKAVSISALIREITTPGFNTTIKPSPPTAPPGRSNHNAGLSVDIDTGLSIESFAAGKRTAVFNWLVANAGKYGFVRDVPVEPWHWSCVACGAPPS